MMGTNGESTKKKKKTCVKDTTGATDRIASLDGKLASGWQVSTGCCLFLGKPPNSNPLTGWSSPLRAGLPVPRGPNAGWRVSATHRA